MRLFSFILTLFIIFSGVLRAQSENPDDNVSTIFDTLQEPGIGKGDVVIHQSNAIREMIGAHLHGANVETSEEESVLKIPGFRTQVFSGNNQRQSKDEAFNKEKEINEMFPEVPTYVSYNAPFWRLRVGDFRTHEEAYHLMRQLKQAFPSYGKEMYIVQEEIRLPLN